MKAFLAIIFLLSIVSCGNPTGDAEGSAISNSNIDAGLESLEAVGSITLVEPLTSVSADPTPTIEASGVEALDTLYIYSDSDCSTEVTSGTGAQITIPTLTSGTHTFYAKRVRESQSIESPCSSASLEYIFNGIALTLMSDDLTPSKSKVFNWGCSGVASCESRFLVNSSSTHTFTAEVYGASTTTTESTGTGTFYIHIQVRDTTDSSVESSVYTYQFVLDNSAVVSITSSPSINLATAGAYIVSGTCSDNTSTVNVDVGGVTSSMACTSLAWSTTSIVSSLTDGSVTVTVNHTDALGNVSTPATASVTKDVDPATVTVTSTTIINSNNSSSYIASGACSDNLETVSIDIDGVTSSTTCSSLSWSTTSSVGALSEGNVTITANHSDSFGNNATPGTGTVVKDAIAAEISSIVAPVDGTYGEGSTFDFQVKYNEPVVVTGTPCFDVVLDSSTESACYTSGSSSSTIFFSYTISSGDSDADGVTTGSSISGGTINDANTNGAETSISADMPSLSSILINTSITPPNQVASVNQTELSVSRTDATFTWVAPSGNGNTIAKYIVRYRLVGASEYIYFTPEPTTNSVTITGLTADSNYEVQIAAFSLVLGPYSSTLSFSTEFSPATLGALIWFEANDIDNSGTPLADGTSVATLIDKSGNGNNATAISGTPATIETVGGKKVLQLSSSGYRTISSLGEGANTDIEVYIVAKTRQISNSFAFSNENEGNGGRYGTHFPWGNGTAYIDLPMANRIQGAWGGNITDFFAWTFRFSTTQGRALERDGTPVLSSGNKTGTQALKRWSIGSNYAGGLIWKADVQAIFVFDKVLDLAQRNDFYDYIETNYGVTMN